MSHPSTYKKLATSLTEALRTPRATATTPRRDEHHVVEGVDDRLARLVQDADDQLAATVDQRINYRSHRQRRMMYLFSFVKPLTYTYTCCTRTCTYLWPPTLALVRITSYSS